MLYERLNPKWIAFGTAVALHIAVALIVGVHIAQVTPISDHATAVDILSVKTTPIPKRRMPPREVKSTHPPQVLRVQAIPPQQPVTTAVKSSADDTPMTLPPTEVSIPVESYLSEKTVRGDSLELARPLGVNAVTVVPSLQPQRPTQSILHSIEAETAPVTDALAQTPQLPISDTPIQPPQFLHKVAPKYPEMARRAQKEGVVWLEAFIGTDGIPLDIRVTEGIGFGCDAAAVAALKKSRFVPAKRGEEAVALRIQIPYRFTMTDGE